MTLLSDLYTGEGNVFSTNNITDHKLVRGDGGAKNVQESTIVVDDSGRMTNPSQPAFNAFVHTQQNDVTGDGTVYNITGAFFTERFDQGNNLSDGTFTAPITGKYLLSFGMHITGIGEGHTYLDITITTSNKNYLLKEIHAFGIDVGTGVLLNGSVVADMDVNDTAHMRLQISGTGKTVDIVSANTAFSGALIC